MTARLNDPIVKKATICAETASLIIIVPKAFGTIRGVDRGTLLGESPWRPARPCRTIRAAESARMRPRTNLIVDLIMYRTCEQSPLFTDLIYQSFMYHPHCRFLCIIL